MDRLCFAKLFHDPPLLILNVPSEGPKGSLNIVIPDKVSAEIVNKDKLPIVLKSR